MDNALTTTNPGQLPAEASTAERWSAIPVRAKMMLGAGIAALIAVVVALAMWGNHGDYKVLYANLSDKDSGAIIAQLSQLNIPFKHSDGGAAILVPADKVHDARLKLATAGLPKGSTIGFELMDNARFGQTQFQERLTFQRGLEGELTRSISLLAAVESARVHLALPNQNGFFREQQKPSASVLLTIHPGRTLDRAQVAGIVHLVSSSVPELSPKSVSVLDQTGALLSDAPDSSGQGLDAQQLQYVAQIEKGYAKRIADILEPVVGRDNLRANVTAELDFSQTESTAEQYRPNQGTEPATLRSVQTTESSTPGQASPTGVPGATSNQPPQQATAPINGASAPLQTAQGGNNGGATRRDNVMNYEVDKTVRVTRAATGTVKRLNAAVVVNHRSTTDPKGKVVTTPLTPEEIEKLTALVQESIGFNKDRGDSVKLINAPFKAEPAPKPDDIPLWKQPWLVDLIRAGGVPVALLAIALIVVSTLIKPALKAANPPPPPVGQQLDAVVADEVEVDEVLTPDKIEPHVFPRLEDARAMAKDNPGAVANIVRGWVNGETA